MIIIIIISDKKKENNSRKGKSEISVVWTNDTPACTFGTLKNSDILTEETKNMKKKM